MFLSAFVDKTFGLGFATAAEDAWINGGSPTFGFLNFATEGKLFHDFFAGLAGPVADWLFMAGLFGIGLALILGVGMRIAAGTAVGAAARRQAVPGAEVATDRSRGGRPAAALLCVGNQAQAPRRSARYRSASG